MKQLSYDLAYFEVIKVGDDCFEASKISDCHATMKLTCEDIVISITSNNSVNQSYTFAYKDVQFLYKKDHLRIVTKSNEFKFWFKSIQKIVDFVTEFECIRNTNGFEPVQSDLKSLTSAFEQRTEKESSDMYFNFYAQLSQQQNMLLDSIRTYTYFEAIVQNPTDYYDKVVLDVGAGSGILSFFAVQAGAKKVYAVEASDIAFFTQKLIEHNTAYKNAIELIKGKVEEIQLPELVDTIISEPLGYLLINERMLESFVHAKKFLKPNGKIFPTHSILYFVPFTDEYLYSYIGSRSSFWSTTAFYGIDLSVLKDDAQKESFSQPIIDCVDTRSIQSTPSEYRFDFTTLNESDFEKFEIPFSFVCCNSGLTHGFAFWFDVAFIGSKEIWLSTSPSQPTTHWYQVKCLFNKPINFRLGTELVGRMLMVPNKKQSYFIDIEAYIESNPASVAKAYIDLKNPIILTGVPIPRPNVMHNPSNQAQVSNTNQ